MSDCYHTLTAFLTKRKEPPEGAVCLFCAIPKTTLGTSTYSLPLELLSQKALKPML